MAGENASSRFASRMAAKPWIWRVVDQLGRIELLLRLLELQILRFGRVVNHRSSASSKITARLLQLARRGGLVPADGSDAGSIRACAAQEARGEARAPRRGSPRRRETRGGFPRLPERPPVPGPRYRSMGSRTAFPHSVQEPS